MVFKHLNELKQFIIKPVAKVRYECDHYTVYYPDKTMDRYLTTEAPSIDTIYWLLGSWVTTELRCVYNGDLVYVMCGTECFYEEHHNVAHARAAELREALNALREERLELEVSTRVSLRDLLPPICIGKRVSNVFANNFLPFTFHSDCWIITNVLRVSSGSVNVVFECREKQDTRYVIMNIAGLNELVTEEV